MELSIITEADIRRRTYWTAEIKKLSGNFGDDFTRLSAELEAEMTKEKAPAVLAHLRLCGAIPEDYGHDSSEEKLYSKYTDAVLAHAFRHVGLRSLVLQERADSADVECVAGDYSFVADAKAFRLSRTAKNQKDFKVQAMDGWKRGKPYAIVVCPVYQLPVRASQIYQQAIARDVCVFTYSHLAVLVQLAKDRGEAVAIAALKKVLACIAALNPTKDATQYWTAINRTMLGADKAVGGIWQKEKLAALDSIAAAKEEALIDLARERERIMRLSHEAAVEELVAKHKISSREQMVRAVADSGILALE